MSYTKKYLYKKQYSTDEGQTWEDVTPLEVTASGDSFGYYDTLEECQTTPYGLKFYATFSNKSPLTAECNGNPELNGFDTGGFDENMTSAIIGDCVIKIGDACFMGNESNLTSVTISDSVEIIGHDAFHGSSNLVNLSIGNGVLEIRDRAFIDCASLTSITMPSGVTSIGDSAFDDCASLTSITIPSGVTNIGNSAFKNCRGLTSITVNATTPPTLGGNYYTQAFDNTNNCNIYVPNNSVESYKTATFWDKYADRIKPISEKP